MFMAGYQRVQIEKTIQLHESPRIANATCPHKNQMKIKCPETTNLRTQ